MLRSLLAAAIFLPFAARADIDPGNWELSVTTQVEGLPGVIGPIVERRCFAPEDARDPGRVLGPAASAGCEFSDRNDTGSVFSFSIRCGGPAPMEGSGTVRYGRGTLESDISLRGSANGQNFGTRARVSGRRLGAC